MKTTVINKSKYILLYKSIPGIQYTILCSLNKNTHSMYGGDCDAAIAKAAAAVTHVQSQSQEVGSGNERAGLVVF